MLKAFENKASKLCDEYREGGERKVFSAEDSIRTYIEAASLGDYTSAMGGSNDNLSRFITVRANMLCLE